MPAISSILRVLPYLGFAIAVWFAWPVVPPAVQMPDHFIFWYAGHLTATGQSPYDIASWRPAATSYGPVPEGVVTNVWYGSSAEAQDLVWLYPPWTGLLLAPFGALPLVLGVLMWHVFIVITGAIAIVASARIYGPRSSAALAIALTTAALFQPVIADIRTGQLDAVILCGVVLLTIGVVRERTSSLVGGAVIVSLKPHVVLLPILLAAWREIRARAWGRIAAVTVALLALAIVGFAFVHVDLGDVVRRLRAAPADRELATTWQLTRDLVPSQPVAAAIVLIALCSGFALIIDRAVPPERRTVVRMALMLALTRISVPYARSYDGVLLVPLLFVAFACAERRPALVTAFAIVALGVPWWISTNVLIEGVSSLNAVTPVFVLGVTALVALVTRGLPAVRPATPSVEAVAAEQHR